MTTKHSIKQVFLWGLAAAVLAMLAVVGYLLRENLVMRDRIAQIQKEKDLGEKREQELQQEISSQKTADTKTKTELSRVREKLLRAQRQLALLNQTSKQPPPAVKIVALNLTPQTRAFGKTQLLSLSPEADYVSVTLQLETLDFREYQVTLKILDEENAVWLSGKLKPVGKTVQFGMPAKLLEEGNYIFELSGLDDDVPEIISGFPFRVVME